MPAPFLLALPCLHAELCTLPASCHTLWPGLPSPPAHAWQPQYPWSADMAAACLEDFRRSARDGAGGSPVLALGAAPAPEDLTPGEREALRELAGLPAQPCLEPRLQAQQMLLLAWLGEAQILELAALEQQARAGRAKLSASLFGEGASQSPAETAAPAPEGLPEWRGVLAAALTFLPDMPAETALLVTSSAMAEAVDALCPNPKAAELPADFAARRALRLPARAMLALCGKSRGEELARHLPAWELERQLTILLPGA